MLKPFLSVSYLREIERRLDTSGILYLVSWDLFPTMFSREVQFAIDLVSEASSLAESIRQGGLPPELVKGDQTPVTVADYAIQALAARRLLEEFGETRLVAEESADELQKPQGRKMLKHVARILDADEETVCEWIGRSQVETEGKIWVLDPIDGTKGFLRGGQYAVALALLENHEVTAGILGSPGLVTRHSPAGGSLAVAVRGEGAWGAPLENPEELQRVSVSDLRDHSKARVLRSVESGHTNESQMQKLRGDLGIGPEPVLMDSQAKYAALASGGGDLLVRLISPYYPRYKEKIWDQAAGTFLVEEAGGKVTDLDGKALDFSQGIALNQNRGILASNGHLHELALASVARIEAIPPDGQGPDSGTSP